MTVGKPLSVGKTPTVEKSQPKKTDSIQAGSKEEINKNETLQYWFLLDPELVGAIEKGNSSLLHLASQRVQYLKPKIKPDLLNEGLKGKEDALFEILRQLCNNGYWDKAQNLKIRNPSRNANEDDLDERETLRFIKANTHLVHPNTLKALHIKDNDSVRMALNQIHYGSLREMKRGVAAPKTKSKTENKHPTPSTLSMEEQREEADLRQKLLEKKASVRRTLKTQPSSALMDFIRSQKNKIEPTIWQEAMEGDEKAISFALGQIHHKSLEEQQPHPKTKTEDAHHSFKEALTNPHHIPAAERKKSTRQNGVRRPTPKSNTVYLTGFKDSVQLKDLWILFRKSVTVRDIILPRKTGVSGNRYGFVITENAQQAMALIEKFHKKNINSNVLHLEFAKGKKSRPNLHFSPNPRAPARESSPKVGDGKAARVQTPKKRDENDSVKSREDGFAKITQNIKVDSINHSNVNTPPKVEQCRQLQLEKDENFIAELGTSLFLETAVNMSVGTVESILAGLGFGDASVRGMSQNTFIAFFPDIQNLDELDLDFMSIGFNSVKRVEWDHTIPSRRIDVEFRGLPLIGWTPKNCDQLVAKWGSILSYYTLIDSDGFYRAPKIYMETSHTSCIDEAVSILIEGKTWEIRIVEVTSYNCTSLQDDEEQTESEEGEVVSPNPYDSVRELEVNEHVGKKEEATDVRGEEMVQPKQDHVVQEEKAHESVEKVEEVPEKGDLPSRLSKNPSMEDNTLNQNEAQSENRSAQKKALDKSIPEHKEEVYTLECKEKDYTNTEDSRIEQEEGEFFSHEDSSGSLINPVTPPALLPEDTVQEQFTEQEKNQPSVIIAEEEIKDWNLKWQVRDLSSDDATASHSNVSQRSSVLDEETVEYLDSENNVLLSNIDQMRIKSRRGRPSKGKSRKKENKAFKVPRRRKIKGMKMGLPIIMPKRSPQDEARFVYDSALNMGLLPAVPMEVSLQQIRANLE
ncbi:hypothetical protein ACET3Z_018363 [Daucus carota]